MKFYLRLLIVTAFALPFVGCLHEDTPTTPKKVQSGPSADSTTVDPYTADVMKKALVSLVSQAAHNGPALGKKSAISEAEEFIIEPNYLYVRFLPVGNQQVKALRNSDTNLVLFDQPLDYRVSEDVNPQPYHDLSLPDSVRPYFTAVPMDYVFNPEFPYEILKPLFLVQPIQSALDTPEDGSQPDPLLKLARTSNAVALAAFLKAQGFTLHDLEMAALKLTGNFDTNFHLAPKAGLAKTAFWDRWRPSGTLKYRDSRLGDIPVEGVRVTTGYTYYWRSARTNSNGYFSSPERWTYSVKYKAHWDGDDFLMEDHESPVRWDLLSEGPTSYSAWNRTFINEHAAYAAIFTGAWNYYYKLIDGLLRPRQNELLNAQLDLQISNRSTGDFGMHATMPFFANYIIIRINDQVNGNVFLRRSDDLFGTAIHELGHSSHCYNFQRRYLNLYRELEWADYISVNLKDTWARGVQWWLTNKKYPGGYNVPYYSRQYSGAVQDLIDSDATFGLDFSPVSDRVSGFNIRQIEAAVMVSQSLTDLRDNLLRMYPSGSGPTYTHSDMNVLFAHWENY